MISLHSQILILEAMVLGRTINCSEYVKREEEDEGDEANEERSLWYMQSISEKGRETTIISYLQHFEINHAVFFLLNF